MDIKQGKEKPEIRLCAPNIVRRTMGKPPQLTWSLVGNSKKSMDYPWQGAQRNEIFSGASVLTLGTHHFESLNGLELVSGIDGIKFIDSKKGIDVFCDHERGFFESDQGFEYWFKRSDEYIFGLGEKSGGLNKKNRRYRMRNTDALGYNAEFSDPLYKHWPFFIVKNPNSSFAVGVFFDHTNDITFDFGCEIDNYYGAYNHVVSKSSFIDQYFFVGSSVAEVSKLFSRAIGGQVFMPKWSLGNLASTMQYTEAENPDKEIKKFIQKAKQEEIPYSGFHFSSGYSLFGKKRFVFEWNKQKISDPAALLATLKDAGIKSAVNIKPCLLEGHPKFEEVKKQKLFIGQSLPGSEPLTVTFWDSDGAFLDFSNPLAVAWWKRQVKENLLELGVDCIWNDNNEFNTRNEKSEPTSIEGFGNAIRFEDHRPLQTLLMVKASFEAQKEYSLSDRPMQITRSGMPGVQRYASTWTGDNYSSWHGLKFSTPLGLGLSLSGFGNFGHDIGGFAGPAPEPELLLRWVQTGIFQPRFCIHSWNSDNVATEPWMYDQNKSLIKSAIQRRYELMPYLYSLMYQQFKNDELINRPIFYDFPEDPRTYDCDFEFMCGPNLLVAPIHEKSAKQRSIYLPSRVNWFSLAQKKWFKGGQIIEEGVSEDCIPVFVKDGSILPKSKTTSGLSCDSLEVFLSKESSTAEFDLYQDDGHTLSHENGDFCIQSIRAERVGSEIKVSEKMSGKDKFKSHYSIVII